VAGHELLNNPKVKTRLAKLIKDRNDSVKVDMFYVVEKLKQVMEADFTEWSDLGKDGMDISKLSDMPKHIRQMVSTMKRTDTTSRDGVTTSRFEFKLMDKTKCLEMLGKHVGAFTDKFHIDVDVKVKTFTDMVLEAKQKRLIDVTPDEDEE
jgi:hypothetical protein